MTAQMSVQDLAREQIRAAFAGDWPVLRRLYAEDVRYRDPDGEHAGAAQVLEHLRGQVEAFTGFEYTIRRTYSDGGDSAVAEWTMSGTSDGKPVVLDVMTAYDFLGDRIVSERNYWDNVTLLTQLGLMPAG